MMAPTDKGLSPGCVQVLLKSPILLESQMETIKGDTTLKTQTFGLTFKAGTKGALEAAVQKLCSDVEAAVRAGCQCVVLSDRATGVALDPEQPPIPSLLATGAVHHHLIRTGLRSDTSIVVDTAQAFSTHHAAMLIGYGAHAICPYLAYETARQWRLSSRTQSLIKSGKVPDVSVEGAQKNLKKSLEKGILKILSKMGISLLSCYHGAQIFECYGLGKGVVDMCFTGSVSRIGGMNMDDLQREAESFWVKVSGVLWVCGCGGVELSPAARVCNSVPAASTHPCTEAVTCISQLLITHWCVNPFPPTGLPGQGHVQAGGLWLHPVQAQGRVPLQQPDHGQAAAQVHRPGRRQRRRPRRLPGLHEAL